MSNDNRSQKPSGLVRALMVGVPLALSVPVACGVINTIEYARSPDVQASAARTVNAARETTANVWDGTKDGYHTVKNSVDNGYYAARYGNCANCGDIASCGTTAGLGLLGAYLALRPWRRNRKQ